MNTSPFPFPLLATAMGSMPHADPQEAVAAVLEALPELPAWPQLYHRSPLEHMGPQFAEGLSNSHVEGDTVVLEGMPGEHGNPELSWERAPGFHSLLQADLRAVSGIKGQVTGPLTFSYLARTEHGRRAFEDLRVARRLAHHLGQVAAWQEAKLRQAARHTLLFLDEPLLDKALAEPRLGPAVVSDLLTTTLIWLRGPKGLHCCAPPLWEFLLSMPFDVISFDAYSYAATTEAAAPSIGAFLAQGGVIAWGMVPTLVSTLEQETAESLADRVMQSWDRLAERGVPRELLEHRALITPACGLAHMTPQGAVKALMTARRVACLLRDRSTFLAAEAVR